jgi:flagellar biosynthetic protein FliP
MTSLLVAANTPSVDVNIGNLAKPSQAIVTLLAVSLLAVAPSLLVMLTGFPRMVIVMSLARNAMGLQSGTPPNQVIAGLALFFSLFIMAPTLGQINKVALQPYLNGHMSFSKAVQAGEKPLKTWMLKQTDASDLAFTEREAHQHPATPADASIVAVIPAFLLSQLKSAFLIGFVVFIPFLIIDLLVSSTLMSMGIVMLPPTLVSLPFKILLFVMVDGWTLLAQTLFRSFS